MGRYLGIRFGLSSADSGVSPMALRKGSASRGCGQRMLLGPTPARQSVPRLLAARQSPRARMTRTPVRRSPAPRRSGLFARAIHKASRSVRNRIGSWQRERFTGRPLSPGAHQHHPNPMPGSASLARESLNSLSTDRPSSRSVEQCSAAEPDFWPTPLGSCRERSAPRWKAASARRKRNQRSSRRFVTRARGHADPQLAVVSPPWDNPCPQ